MTTGQPTFIWSHEYCIHGIPWTYGCTNCGRVAGSASNYEPSSAPVATPTPRCEGCGHHEAHHVKATGMRGTVATEVADGCRWQGCGCPWFVAEKP